MTIQFHCPSCDALIAFKNKHCGKRARCLTCGQVFIIPSKDDEKPKTIEPEQEKTEPIPGFYRAVFVENWKLFLDPENITTLTFVTAVVCFKFFLAHTICCMEYISWVLAWGWLLGFYLNIIYETALDIDKLPEIYLGTGTTFLWYVIKPFLVFFFTMFVVQLPFIIVLASLKDRGFTYENMWQTQTSLNLLLQFLFIIGLSLFPVAILTLAVGLDVTMLRPDYILTPVFRKIGAYLIVVALLVAACVLEMQTNQYDPASQTSIALNAARLGLNLLVQIIAIIAMRSIGLFYRHYSGYFPW